VSVLAVIEVQWKGKGEGFEAPAGLTHIGLLTCAAG